MPGGRRSGCLSNCCRAWRGFATVLKFRRDTVTRARRSADPAEEPALPIGEEFDFKIIKMNEAQKRIGLSMRAFSEDEERRPAGRLPAPGGCSHLHCGRCI